MALADTPPPFVTTELQRFYEEIRGQPEVFDVIREAPESVIPAFYDKYLDAAFELVAAAARVESLSPQLRSVAVLFMFYFLQMENNFSDEPCAELQSLARNEPSLQKLFLAGRFTVNLGENGFLYEEVYEILQPLVAAPIVIFADRLLFDGRRDNVEKGRVIALAVDFSSIGRVMALGKLEKIAYQLATTHRDTKVIVYLEQLMPCDTIAASSSVRALVEAVQSENTCCEVMAAGESIILKLRNLPKDLVHDVTEALKDERISAIVLAYFANHVQGNHIPFHASTRVVAVAQASNPEALHSSYPYVVKAPSLYSHCYVSIWSLSSSPSQGIALAKSVSRLIAMYNTQVWCDNERHKCMFNSNVKCSGDVTGFDLQRVFKHHEESDSQQWISAIKSQLCQGGAFRCEYNTVLPAKQDPNGYLFLFTWNSRFHELCLSALAPYLRHLPVKFVRKLSVDPPKKRSTLRS